ncbi:MAG: SMP-30/gluconolactonase/LRE family protein [Chloroflexota bacterium]|nr:SMP-30/gluconolactonase/LRE family protein [Chloroflexota bacterium]
MAKIFRDPKDLKKEVEFFDKNSRQLFSNDQNIRKIFEGCLWAEGPVYLKEKNIIVWSDIPYNRMLYYNLANEKTGTYRYPSNFSNGNSVDLDGFMITAEHGRRAISRTAKEGDVEVITNQVEGNKYNSPNDLVCKSDGTIWFTDPQYGIMSNYEGYESRSETKYNGVYLIDKNKEVKLITSEIDAPNGIAFSPDEKTIYITDTGSTGNIFSFDVINNSIQNKKIFATPRPGKPDGIKVDVNGNVLSSAWDGVQIYSPKGKLIAKIQIPEQRTANLCFGGENFNELFIASDKSLYKIKMETSGNKVN